MDPRKILKERTAGNNAAWAKENGVSASYVSDVLAGRREPGKLILDALDLERVVTYRRKKDQP